MCRQYAQPFIWETRPFTRSSSFGSKLFASQASTATRASMPAFFWTRKFRRLVIHASMSSGDPGSALFREGRQVRLRGVQDEHGEKPRGLGGARIGADGMTVSRTFGEAFARAIGGHRPIVDLASDRTLKDRRVDERRVRMGVRGRRAAGLIFDQHAS